MAISPSLWMRRVCAAAIVVCAVLACLLAATAQNVFGRDALWRIVHDECVPDQMLSHDPRPCAQVDLQEGTEKGFAVLKDIRGRQQYLLIPTARIAGIESPQLLAPDAPNYFADAWNARVYVDQALHQTLPREDIALAINSIPGRTQDQLHIHIDCVRPDVQRALHLASLSIGPHWTRMPITLSSYYYWAMWVPGDSLGSNNPFQLLAQGIPSATSDMGNRTLVVVGWSRPNGDPGFIVLEDEANSQRHDIASGEDLMDHSCRVASAAPAAPPAPRK